MKRPQVAGRGEPPRIHRLERRGEPPRLQRRRLGANSGCEGSDPDRGEGSDPAVLARLHASLFPDAPWGSASFRELLAHSGAIAFVASAGTSRETVGFIVGRVAADEAEILTLGVERDWQHLGLGRRLVQALVGAAKDQGARRLYLEVAAGNGAARALYGRLGFRESGRRRGYYAHVGATAEDAVNLYLPI